MTNSPKKNARTAREKAAELRAAQARKDTRRRNLQITSAVAAVLALVIGSGVLLLTMRDNEERSEPFATPRNLTEGRMVVGKKDAPVTIQIYEDFYCPLCGDFERANSEQISDWVKDGTVKVEYNILSILDRLSPDKYPTRAADAAVAVWDSSDVDTFLKFHDKLYEEGVQPEEGYAGHDDAQLIKWAVEAGAPEAGVKAALEGKKFEKWTKQVTDQSSKDDVTGTPTTLVNGEKVGNWTPENLKAAVEKAKE
jgi:protein-disulfide isomerase